MNIRTRVFALLAALSVAPAALAATFNLFSPAAGILKGNPSTYVTTAATSSDVIATWSGTCNSGRFLRADGTCSNSLSSSAQTFTVNDSAAGADRFRVVSDGGALVGSPTGGSQGPGTLNAAGLFVNGAPVSAGGGAVSSVGLALPSVFTVTGSPVTASGTLTGAFATGQPQNQVLATPNGSTGALGLRALVSGDIPALGGNPSVTIGLSAVNGSATTYHRSDSAPALSQSIAPTWTATHAFDSNGSNLRLDGNDPRGLVSESDGATDEKNWLWRSSASAFGISTANDAAPFSAVNDAINITRSGTAVGRVTLAGSGGSSVRTGQTSITAIAGLETNAQILNSDANPSLYMNETDAGTDEKLYRYNSAGGDLVWSTRTDANGAGSTWFTLDRTGTTVNSLNFTATAINLNGVATTDFARLSQSNTFTGNTQQISNTSGPRVVLRDSDATADEQCFFTFSQSSIYSLWASSDANCTSTTGASEVFRVTRTGTTVTGFLFQNGTTRFLQANSPAVVVSPTNANITSRSGSTDVVAALQVNGSAATEATYGLTRANGANSAGPILFLNKSRGTVSAPTTVVNSGDDIGRVVFSGSDGANFSNGAEVSAQVDGTPGANDMPGRLVFSTTADGSNISTERMRINSSGAIGLAGANFGTSGQVIQSNGSTSAPTWVTPPAAVTGANPTASVGLSAVNGAAATFMRSDGAPALDQSIGPTWTGIHKFTGSNTEIENAAPLLVTDETDAAANERSYLWRSVAGDYFLSTATDAAPTTAVNNAIAVSRTGTTVDSVTFAATTVAVTGNATVSGKSTVTNGVTATGGVNAGNRLSASTQSPTSLAANTNNWALTPVPVVLIAASAAVNITGIDASTANADSFSLGNNVFLHLINKSSSQLTLTNEDANSTAANRFTLPYSASFVLGPNESVQLYYDSVASRWYTAGAKQVSAQVNGTFNLDFNTGCTTTFSTGSHRYAKIGNQVTLQLVGGGTCTSNATTFFTATSAMPAEITPDSTVATRIRGTDNGAAMEILFQIASTGRVTLLTCNANGACNSAGWTNTGTKGFTGQDITITYNIDNTGTPTGGGQ